MKFETELNDSSSGIELTPLIDVVFQLLVFFMLTATFMLPSLDIQLPAVGDKEPTEHNPYLVISIDSEGIIHIGETVALSDFDDLLTTALSKQEEQTIFLQADGEVSYQDVLALMDRLRQGGVEQINFLHNKDE